MSFWSAIVLIVAIIAFTEVMKSRHRAERGGTRDSLANEDLARSHDAEARREIENLRERIKVLERIATDSNTLGATETRRIAAEIEALREKQAD